MIYWEVKYSTESCLLAFTCHVYHCINFQPPYSLFRSLPLDRSPHAFFTYLTLCSATPFSLSAYMGFPAASLSPFLSIEILERGDVTRKILTSPPKTEPTTAPLFPNTHNKCKIDRPSAKDSLEQNNISRTRCATAAARGYDSKHLCQKSGVVYIAILLFLLARDLLVRTCSYVSFSSAVTAKVLATR